MLNNGITRGDKTEYINYTEKYSNTKNNTFVYFDLIKKVIFNNPYTIIIWFDGTKTIVKAENESFDKEKGLAMALSKKFLGNTGKYYDLFKKWIY